MVPFAVIRSVQLLSCKQAIRVPFAAAHHILAIDGHGGAIVRGMVGTTGLKGIVAVQTGFDHKGAPGAHPIIGNIHWVSNIFQVTVQRQVQVQFKPETHLLQIRVPVGTV